MSNDTSPARASELQSLLATDSTESSLERGYDAFDEDDPIAWFPEKPVSDADWESICASKKVTRELAKAMRELPIEVSPSEFTSFAFRMPRLTGPGFERFSFEGRRHMFAIYNTSAPRVLLTCARQTEKSTTLGNLTLNYSCLIPSFKTLYVSPSSMQTKVFSNDRIKEAIETSPVLQSFTNNVLSQNVFEKQFVNRSKITLRYSFLNADRVRGIAAYMLLIDEIQDIIEENIPIIERCTDHAPDHFKRYVYSGTPKSVDNTIEKYRSRHSRQGEWVVPCDRCGGGDFKYWNILGEQNIGKKGLICAKCGEKINPQHPDAQWAFMVDDAPFESYRINGLMVPWKKWSEILFDYETNGRAKFFNEVLGLSYDSGIRPLTMKQVRDCCKEHISMHPKDLRQYYTAGYDKPVFMGLDYGSGENSYTIITIGTYVDSKFRIIYMERCIGEMMEPERQVEHIIELANKYHVARIGADYGGGFDRNDKLMRTFGSPRLIKFQYMARARKKIEWDPRLLRFKVQRTEVMSDIFNALKRNQFEFPRWAEFENPYAIDMLNIFSEYNEQLRQIQYKHSIDKPDDSFHSLLYCFLASMTVIPRPDVITPRRQVNHEQAIFGNPYSGPTNQGRESIW